jgi:hypothetical protein
MGEFYVTSGRAVRASLHSPGDGEAAARRQTRVLPMAVRPSGTVFVKSGKGVAICVPPTN